MSYFLRGLILGGVAAGQPGPLQAFLVSLVVRVGRRQALPAALSPLISDGPIVFLVLVVLTQVPSWLLFALRVGGGVFLLYLAWSAWQTARRPPEIAPEDPTLPSRGVLQAAVMNFLSPGPYIFWATINGPILLEGWRNSPGLGLSFLAGFYGALIGGLAIFIIVVSVIGGIGPRATRGLGFISAVALLAFGVYQLAAGVSGLRAELA